MSLSINSDRSLIVQRDFASSQSVFNQSSVRIKYTERAKNTGIGR